jgi:hypothetical protein
MDLGPEPLGPVWDFFSKPLLVVFLVVVVEACDTAGMGMMLFRLGFWEGRGQGFLLKCEKIKFLVGGSIRDVGILEFGLFW